MSAAKFIKPCVFLFHGDALPYGKYWDIFTKYYPRIIHIYRECPKKVGNSSINWIEHSADLMRIEALIGESTSFIYCVCKQTNMYVLFDLYFSSACIYYLLSVNAFCILFIDLK